MLIAHFSFVTASHGMLDAMTDGGLGVAFFAPFDNARYFFPMETDPRQSHRHRTVLQWLWSRRAAQ
jgi:hypothetical protein